jgi:hypothetical protein
MAGKHEASSHWKHETYRAIIGRIITTKYVQSHCKALKMLVLDLYTELCVKISSYLLQLGHKGRLDVSYKRAKKKKGGYKRYKEEEE